MESTRAVGHPVRPSPPLGPGSGRPVHSPVTPVRTWARQAAGELVFQATRHRNNTGLAILMYHAVTETDICDDMQMSVSARRFAAQMAALRELDVDVLSVAEGVTRLRSGNARLAVTVVFDDGFVGVHDYAGEILAAHRIPATIFVTTEWVGRDAFPAGNRLLGRPMTWSEVRSLMQAANCTVGSHGASHAALTDLSSGDVDAELQRSRDAIADATEETPRQFAYPFGTYGAFDGRTRAAIAAAGFEVACTTIWGRNRPATDPLALRRLRVSWCD